MKPEEKSEAVVTAVRNWYASLRTGLANLSDEPDGQGRMLRITPVAQGAAWVEFRVAPYGKFDFYLGKAGLFDEVDASPELAIEVCEAARRGQITDYIRVWRGRQIAASTVIELPSGKRLKSRVVPPIGFLPIGTRTRVEYVPWA